MRSFEESGGMCRIDTVPFHLFISLPFHLRVPLFSSLRLSFKNLKVFSLLPAHSPWGVYKTHELMTNCICCEWIQADLCTVCKVCKHIFSLENGTVVSLSAWYLVGKLQRFPRVTRINVHLQWVDGKRQCAKTCALESQPVSTNSYRLPSRCTLRAFETLLSNPQHAVLWHLSENFKA